MNSKMSEMSEMPETLLEKSKKSKMSGMSLMPETLPEKSKSSLVSGISLRRWQFLVHRPILVRCWAVSRHRSQLSRFLLFFGFIIIIHSSRAIVNLQKRITFQIRSQFYGFFGLSKSPIHSV